MQFPIEEAARAIQTILAPAVMISACGLLLLGMQNRYGRINDRMRALARERLDLLPKRGDPVADVRLDAIERQMPDLLLRVRIQRNAVYSLFAAVVVFVADAFVIAASLFLATAMLNMAALAVFLMGMVLVLAGTVLAAQEIAISARAVVLEVEETMRL
ncbi:MAG: hypothetical protein Kow00123_07760 [Anaerolineales bacterium]